MAQLKRDLLSGRWSVPSDREDPTLSKLVPEARFGATSHSCLLLRTDSANKSSQQRAIAQGRQKYKFKWSLYIHVALRELYKYVLNVVAWQVYPAFMYYVMCF